MPRPLHDLKQPQIGPSAGDLGQSAYEASLRDDAWPQAEPQDEATVRPWEAPEPLNPAPMRGSDVKD